MYRTSDETPLVPALIEAAENGKQSVCLVELKARFDERRNIEWSQALERAGVHVVYGFPNLKIHAKATLVVRREVGGLKRYVHIGTGQLPLGHRAGLRGLRALHRRPGDRRGRRRTSSTTSPASASREEFRKLLVAPFNLRDRLIEEIRRVAAGGRRAEEAARIRLKVNNLSDKAIIDELYLASQAGAKIDLIVRSVCALRPGRQGDEREHPRSQRARPLSRAQPASSTSRPAASGSYFIGSADLLPRNLDHRLEAVAPVEDPRLQRPPRRGARRAAGGHDRLGASVRRVVDGGRPEEGRAAPLGPGDPDALGPPAAAPAHGDLLAVSPLRHRKHPACRPGSRGECPLR